MTEYISEGTIQVDKRFSWSVRVYGGVEVFFPVKSNKLKKCV